MLSYIAGVVLFLLLYIAKRTLVSVLIHKKQVALSALVIVLSETLIVFMLYISIDKYSLNSIKLLIGFLISTAIMIGLYSYKFLDKGSERIDDGEL